MATNTLKLRPGIDIEQSPVLNEAGWSASTQIRFFQGMPQKRGGWARLSNTAVVGTATGMHAWADLDGNPYIAIGTDQRLELFFYGIFYDITPQTKTDDVSPAFATTNGLATVRITDSAFGGADGDWVFIPVPVSIGGLILQGFYQITTVIDASNYTVTASANATATATGGAVPLFTTTSASPNVQVTLNDHGLTAGSLFAIQVATTVGGVTLAVKLYPVLASPAPTTNTFVIAADSAAGSSASASENGGNVRIQYLYPSGVSTASLLAGYGAGPYGGGPYGGGQSGGVVYSVIRQWSMDHWGQDLIANYTGSPIFVWTPPVASVPGTTAANPALAINTTNFAGAVEPPTVVNSCFVSMPQRLIMALGVDFFGSSTMDPLLIRWCDVDDFTDWEASAINQAGSFRLPNGSRIIGGVQAPLFVVIWTDIDMWLGQYLGFPLVWGFTKVESNKGLISERAGEVIGPLVFFAARDSFNVYDGQSVREIPCTVWDQFFNNINWQQIDKVCCVANSFYNEVSWHYPSANSSVVDSRVTYKVEEGTWTYDGPGMQGARTTGIDVSLAAVQQVSASPYFVDTSGLLQQEEVGYDADGQILISSITSGYMTASEGAFLTLIRRLYPDFVTLNPSASSVNISLLLKDYPTDTPTVIGPFTWQAGADLTPYLTILKRARLFAIQIQTNTFGVFWRLGAMRIESTPAGSL